jgi:squalene-hopene/tetraprenyl-beta-curcumene cyclase
MTPGLQVADALVAGVSRAALRASSRLLGLQRADGFWQGDLTADSTLESDWLLLLLWLYPPQGGVWNPPEHEKVDRAARSILERQLPDGGFNIYPSGPSDVSASVKAYFALKLAGLPVDGEPMSKLRERILALGGIQAANSYVKINLSLFNLYPRDHVATVPPEIILLGNLLYQMSSWTRAILMPLSIVQALDGAGRPAPEGFTLQDLFLPGEPLDFHRDRDFFSWHNLFIRLDGCLKWWERHGIRSIRRKAIHAAEKWMLARFEHSDGLGAIYPPMMYSIMALDLLGYAPDSPERSRAQSQFDRLLIDTPDRFEFQPCYSPVWDTAITMFSLGEAGSATPDSLDRAARWLLAKEVRRWGDWSVKRPKAEPSGWYFEFANEFYPDIDDTAMVLLALAHSRDTGLPGVEEAAQRAIGWLLAMQSHDGGWAAFDVDNNWEFLSNVPFADHNAMLDPTCPDITGRVLEALGRWGLDPGHEAIQRGIQYLLKTQGTDGSWFGRWGVDYVYGTFLALRGLRAVGYDDHEAAVLRGGEWLRSVQNADGGWGESCASYDRKCFVGAPSTPSQTAWAVLGLLAGGDTTSESVSNGIEYLVQSQREDGSWDEALATGTGFPRVFYLSYHLYRDSFPLLALAEFQRVKAAEADSQPGGELGARK